MNKTKTALISIILFVVSIGVTNRLIFPKVGAESNGLTFARATPTPAETDEFRPEIFGLPDYDDDYYADQPSLQAKLVDIQSGNNFRKDEVIAKSGETWLGLFRDKGKFILAKTSLVIVPEERPNFGWEDSVTIRFDKQDEPLFILKDAKNLREGPVKTLYAQSQVEESSDTQETLARGFSEEFQIGSNRYTFRVRDALTNNNDKRMALVLENGRTSQVVDFRPYFEKGDHVGILLWVGDLDGDEKLDFYIDYYTYEKGATSTGLFLSSKAETGELVKKVAGFGTLGC